MDSAISKVFDTLTPIFLQRLGFLFGVEGEAQKLKSTLSRIQALLNDAEARQIKEESVRLWLRELKDAAYDAEDIVDEVEYQVLLRSKREEAQMQTKRRRLTDFVSSSYSNLNMGPRIKEIRERLEEIESRSNQLHLKVKLKSEMLTPGKRHPTSSRMDESILVGRDTDREDVLVLLTSEHSSASDSGVQVVSICGMGGLGKTTLAQLAYNDERVKEHFEEKAWVYVSEDFDLMRLTKAIAESVPGSNPLLTNLDAIEVSIKEALKEKRFLLVLDDVWTEDFDDWHRLMFGARGSRILVTTRSRRVLSSMGTVPTHFLQGLSDDDCWSLFERRAFVDGDSDAHPDLVKIGKEIVNKCNGLPLAVKTLGGLLCSVVDVVLWEKILKSEIWDLPEERNDILPALRLSYHHLPAHLKRCFAYCACLINKGQWGVEGDELIREWMAQGFIQPSEQMEDIGRENLADLVSRSLLNCEERDERLYYTMHDLTHDLARSVLGADFWKIGDEKSHGNNAEKARYMSDDDITSCNFDDFYCLKNLRTLSLFCPENIPADLFIKLRHIRTLILFSELVEVPESIGELLQLRYLDLSGGEIERLPKSTTRLYNLQTLILVGCSKLVEVPESIGDLLQLRYLDLSRTKIERLPKSTTGLSNLQTLKLDFCRKLVEVPESIGDLLQLRYLDLSHTEIERLPKSTTGLSNLQTLKLYFCRKLVEVPESIGDLLQLRYLDLSHTEIERLPKSTTGLSNLQTLKLDFCRKLVEVPESIGDLLQLRYLDLSHTEIERLPKSTTGLSNLQTLKLDFCRKLVEVPESIGDLLQLRYLDLSQTEIERLPKSTTGLSNLQTLILNACWKLVEVPESIGDLLQLRYLDLSHTEIERLPKSTTRLYNLQTLILDYCWELVELPSDLSNLVNLRHLRLNSSSVSIPPKIGTLKDLQTLSNFNVGKEIGCRINELKDLIHLRGCLRISELENVVDLEEAKEAQLKNKLKIDELKLQWTCDDVESRQEGIEEEVLNALQPHTNLKEFEIEGYCGVRFPTWLGDSSFSKLISVTLSKCRCRLLPPFGRLPSLKRLSLEHLYELKKVGHEFYGDGTMTGFPPLESLRFSSMPDLEELSVLESGIRPTIREIEISNCNKLSLSSLRYLTSLSSLKIHNFSNLTSLGNGLQHLTSLQSLTIDECPELTSLYDVDLHATLDDGLGNSNYSNPTCLPKRLKRLLLSQCPKIPSLPEELLTTLQSLGVYGCPLLVEKYLVLAEGGNGYRCKISDIPHIAVG